MTRLKLRNFIISLVLILIISSCSPVATNVTQKSVPAKISPVHIIATSPNTNAVSPGLPPSIWVLTGRPSARVLAQYNLNTWQMVRELPAPGDASIVVESQDGILALGVGSSSSNVGYVEFLSSISLKKLGVLELSAPVISGSALNDNISIALLIGNAYKREVDIINTIKQQIVKRVPVPANTISLSTSSDPNSFFFLTGGGYVNSYSLSEASVSSLFRISPEARDLTITQDQKELLTLQCGPTYCNSVITDTGTESDLLALPMPIGTSAIALVDQKYIIAAVGNLSFGNIQIFNVAKYIH